MASWLVVASADHACRGRQGGFMQACHGKPGPLRRIAPGDGVVIYSPAQRFGGPEPCRAFTAIGHVAEGEPYLVDMGEGFRPWRRDVTWLPAAPVPIAPLLDRLELTAGRRHWGYPLRFGFVALPEPDFTRIASEMARAATP